MLAAEDRDFYDNNGVSISGIGRSAWRTFRGDDNAGGSTRRPLVTAYRENALLVAAVLARHGPLAPKQLRALGQSDAQRG